MAQDVPSQKGAKEIKSCFDWRLKSSRGSSVEAPRHLIVGLSTPYKKHNQSCSAGFILTSYVVSAKSLPSV